jgi:hypothetical protein
LCLSLGLCFAHEVHAGGQAPAHRSPPASGPSPSVRLRRAAGPGLVACSPPEVTSGAQQLRAGT